ncbi:glycosyltransferase [Patescibacteria group bacterium]|nr:glycosyltransferase [Patescibacteria group bacterium]
MTQSTTVSIVMSVYNGAPFLREAIDSMLCQTFNDFEFIIINDGSTDNSESIIQSYDDPRIRYVRQENNGGLAAALNLGLSVATGTYIARMDADGISHPNRLEAQVAFLNTNTHIGVVGTWAHTFGDGAHLWKNPTSPAEIAARMLFSCCLLHPTVMIRAAVLKAANIRYDESLLSGQDYELWAALLPLTQFANLPKVLLHYRLSQNTTSAMRRAEQLANTWSTQATLLAALNLPISGIAKRLHTEPAPQDATARALFLAEKATWLMQITAANSSHKLFSEPALQKVLHSVWFETCTHPPLSFRSLHTCLCHPLFITSPRSVVKVIVVIVKNVLHPSFLRRK